MRFNFPEMKSTVSAEQFTACLSNLIGADVPSFVLALTVFIEYWERIWKRMLQQYRKV